MFFFFFSWVLAVWTSRKSVLNEKVIGYDILKDIDKISNSTIVCFRAYQKDFGHSNELTVKITNINI
jgi:hypothetical protein